MYERQYKFSTFILPMSSSFLTRIDDFVRVFAGLLEVKCVPWLPEEPVAAVDLDLLPVSTVMHSPVTTVQVGPKFELQN